jgi:hypothetical protein
MLLFTVLMAYFLNAYSAGLVVPEVSDAVDKLLLSNDIAAASSIVNDALTQTFSVRYTAPSPIRAIADSGPLISFVSLSTAASAVLAELAAKRPDFGERAASISFKDYDIEISPAYKVLLFFIVALCIVCALVLIN